MIPALLAALLIGAPEDAAGVAYAKILGLFESAQPEPEPPPGLRAAPHTERFLAARQRYHRALAAWRKAESARCAELVRLAGEFLERYPETPRRGAVFYLRGATRFRAGEFAAARGDLETFLATDPGGADAGAARRALVACCRATGDYRAALKVSPSPTPDLLEEAGQVRRAIAAAEAGGERAKAARWKLIGAPFPGKIEIPPRAVAAIVEAGRELPLEVETALHRFVGSGKLAILSGSAPELAIYLLDEEGIVRAVDPRLDTLLHRVRALVK